MHVGPWNEARILLRALTSRGTRRLLRKERGGGHRIPRKPSWLARGFTGASGRAYGLDQRRPDLYVNDRETVRTWSLVPRLYRPILDNKLLTHVVLERVGGQACLPELLGYAAPGTGAMGPLGSEPKRVDLDSLVGGVGAPGVLVRPVEGHASQGVTLVGSPDGQVDVASIDRAVTRLLESGRAAILTRCLRPHRDLAAIDGGSLGTTRVLTVWPSGAAGPLLAQPILHRFATNATRPFASWLDGGISAQVHPDSGELVSALKRTPEGVRPVVAHPETGARITGRKLPLWPEAKELVLRLARGFPGLDYVLWELIVSEGGPRVVEMNHNPGLVHMQAYRPLLLDPGLCAVFLQRGVLESFWRSTETWAQIAGRAASVATSAAHEVTV